jgi:hypothetical protein
MYWGGSYADLLGSVIRPEVRMSALSGAVARVDSVAHFIFDPSPPPVGSGSR